MFKQSKSFIQRLISLLILFSFISSIILPPQIAQAQILPDYFNMPQPGTMVAMTSAYSPAMIKGITIYPDNPLKFDFLVSRGDDSLNDEDLIIEGKKYINYFLAALTVPESEMWVNLSPGEKDRIIPESFRQTEMGRDLLAQDYILKQLTASLLYPEDALGQKFWNKLRKRAKEEYGTEEISNDIFHKVWIVPEKALVYEHGNSAFVAEFKLRVMLENDYLTARGNSGKGPAVNDKEGLIKMEMLREVIVPALEQEVNTGATFANLRQIMQSVILAAWYKENLKASLLGQVYVDKGKTKGIDLKDKESYLKVYNQYLEAFRKGVYDYIKNEYDPQARKMIPRKYFAGGLKTTVVGNDALKVTKSPEIGEKVADSMNNDEAMLTVVLHADKEDPPAVIDPEMMAELYRKFRYEVQMVYWEVPKDSFLLNEEWVKKLITVTKADKTKLVKIAGILGGFLASMRDSAKKDSSISINESFLNENFVNRIYTYATSPKITEFDIRYLLETINNIDGLKSHSQAFDFNLDLLWDNIREDIDFDKLISLMLSFHELEAKRSDKSSILPTKVVENIFIIHKDNIGKLTKALKFLSENMDKINSDNAEKYVRRVTATYPNELNGNLKAILSEEENALLIKHKAYYIVSQKKDGDFYIEVVKETGFLEKNIKFLPDSLGKTVHVGIPESDISFLRERLMRAFPFHLLTETPVAENHHLLGRDLLDIKFSLTKIKEKDAAMLAAPGEITSFSDGTTLTMTRSFTDKNYVLVEVMYKNPEEPVSVTKQKFILDKDRYDEVKKHLKLQIDNITNAESELRSLGFDAEEENKNVLPLVILEEDSSESKYPWMIAQGPSSVNGRLITSIGRDIRNGYVPIKVAWQDVDGNEEESEEGAYKVVFSKEGGIHELLEELSLEDIDLQKKLIGVNDVLMNESEGLYYPLEEIFSVADWMEKRLNSAAFWQKKINISTSKVKSAAYYSLKLEVKEDDRKLKREKYSNIARSLFDRILGKTSFNSVTYEDDAFVLVSRTKVPRMLPLRGDPAEKKFEVLQALQEIKKELIAEAPFNNFNAGQLRVKEDLKDLTVTYPGQTFSDIERLTFDDGTTIEKTTPFSDNNYSVLKITYAGESMNPEYWLISSVYYQRIKDRIDAVEVKEEIDLFKKILSGEETRAHDENLLKIEKIDFPSSSASETPWVVYRRPVSDNEDAVVLLEDIINETMLIEIRSNKELEAKGIGPKSVIRLSTFLYGIFSEGRERTEEETKNKETTFMGFPIKELTQAQDSPIKDQNTVAIYGKDYSLFDVLSLLNKLEDNIRNLRDDNILVEKGFVKLDIYFTLFNDEDFKVLKKYDDSKGLLNHLLTRIGHPSSFIVENDYQLKQVKLSLFKKSYINESIMKFLKEIPEIKKEIIALAPFNTLAQDLQKVDEAMMSVKEKVAGHPLVVKERGEFGGIDLNRKHLDLQIRRDGKGIVLPFSEQPIEALENIEGFIPVIINIAPVVNLPMLLGFADSEEEEDSLRGLSEADKPEEIVEVL